jgi:hypothetical protein
MKTILECLQHSDLRYRLPAAMFQSRYSTVAAARGWITNAPVVDVVPVEPRTINIRWANSDGSIAPPPPTEQVMRDGKLIEMRVYDTGQSETVAPPAGDGARRAGPAASHDTTVEHELGGDDLDEPLKPLIGADRDRVETALRQRPGDRDIILSTVEANGFDISGL